MNEDNKQVYKSIFAVMDENACPVSIKYNTNWDGSADPDKIFAEYLAQHVETALKGKEYVPNYNICRFDLDADTPLHQLKGYNENNSALVLFIIENKGKFIHNISLRDATFMALNVSMDAILDPMMIRNLQSRKYPPDYTRQVKAYGESFDNAPRTIHAIQTAMGTLLTDNSGFGEQLRQRFLQYVGDNFYTPEIQTLEFLEFHKVADPAPELRLKAEYAHRLFDRVSGQFNRFFHLCKVFNGSSLAHEKERLIIAPKFENYADLTGFNGVIPSAQSMEISLLMLTRDHFYPADFKEKPREFRRHFPDIEKRYTQWRENNPDAHIDQFAGFMDEAKVRAINILDKRFGINERTPFISKKPVTINVNAMKINKKKGITL